jgi:hypothetical protein
MSVDDGHVGDPDAVPCEERARVVGEDAVVRCRQFQA